MKINKYNILTFFCIVPAIWPIGMTFRFVPAFGDFITSYGLVISIILSFLTGSRHILKILKNKLHILLTILFLIFIISTTLNNQGRYVDYIKSYCAIYALANIYLSLYYSGRVKVFFDVYVKTMTAFVALAIVMQLMYPEGMAYSYYMNILGDYQSSNIVYFWGNKNYYGYYLLPFITISLIRDEIYYTEKRHIFSLLRIAAVFYLIVSTGSATSLLSLFVFVIYYLVHLFRSGKPIFAKINNSKFIAIMYSAVFLVIVVLQIQNILLIFISKIFSKTVSLSGRMNIWSSALSFIAEKPMLGYGYDKIIPNVGYHWYAHNLVLDIVIQGGITALVIFCILYFSAFKQIDHVRPDKFNERSIHVIYGWLIALAVTLIVESTVKSSPFLYLIFYIAYTFPDLVAAGQLENEDRKRYG